ncbi:MAG: TIGR00303 family protein [Methanocalculus sp.]|uniref:nicotinate mononucleotide-dependent phosphoribosyltransferase CobT n=1 Tax=Methanocalculus sp. TaxID=2004547 RepID=UPI002725A14E|nr:TIGR00303 family protein [Methanocalculus sp.]MDO9540578.1 TIGR00303 family protein [Methanocalculus sp.]
MAFLSDSKISSPKRPIFTSILANTALSKVPGISGAGSSPDKTIYTPTLDAELIVNGEITSMPIRPNTPTGCPTPATITRAMMQLCGLTPLFINAGLEYTPTIPTFDLYGQAGGDPRKGDAVPDAKSLFQRGKQLGTLLSTLSDMLVIGECIPGGTTTALCVLRGLGYSARVSSSFADNPHPRKDEIADAVIQQLKERGITDTLGVVTAAGDPMIPAAAGMANGFSGEVILAGGTQMLAVAAVIKGLGMCLPKIATTIYVHDDASANFRETAEAIGISPVYVDPEFGALGHYGLARYCIGEVKEGMGAGGAMYLAAAMGHSPSEIREAILQTISSYS